MPTPHYAYTVVGYYDDNGQVWVTHVVAADWQDAVLKSARDLERRNDATTHEEREILRNNCHLLSVLEGHHCDLNDSDSTCALIDFPGLEMES
jgi:hypothetical protein